MLLASISLLAVSSLSSLREHAKQDWLIRTAIRHRGEASSFACEKALTKPACLTGEINMRAKVKNIYLTLLSVLKWEEGQDLVEYALILGLISVGAVTALGTLGGKLVSYYGYIVARVP